ncbi:biotin--protein ligase 2 isoform X1 [Cinnamomum micranthum f. kanehirae]|uniref:Biotin--protein ligase 2 isoform X1 n=1 Tax=Cinnamomum micranthum f. kanehirae TaxID=337451 RepID=A0A443PWB1_9MAGN|nr:biotin--protein ligase 2 isoform X1 [Cinnamomum micranthum f. kanehirae]
MDEGFEALEDLFYKKWLHSGQKVVIEEKSEGQSVEATTVTIQGLTSAGYLLAIGEDSEPCELHPDGNSLI